MSVMAIVLSLGLFGIIVGVAYWLPAKTRKRSREFHPRKWTRRNARHDARPQPISLTFLPLRKAQRRSPLFVREATGV